MTDKYKGALHEGTKHLHHAVEHTTYLGRVMTAHEPNACEYMWWLGMKMPIYSRLGLTNSAPEALSTASKIMDDMIILQRKYSVPIHLHQTTRHFAATLNTTEKLLGAAYVTIGGASTGGRIIREKVAHLFPVTNFYFYDENKVTAFVKSLRDRKELVQPARECFQAYLEACNQNPYST